MKGAIWFCILSATWLIAHISYILCYTVNDQALGGHLPFLMLVTGPLLGVALGRYLHY